MSAADDLIVRGSALLEKMSLYVDTEADAATVAALLDALEAAERERDEARAELDDLAADPGHKAAKYWKWWQREKARADRAEAALERVKALHPRKEFDDQPGEFYCGACQRTAGVWPCDTRRAIEGADDA